MAENRDLRGASNGGKKSKNKPSTASRNTSRVEVEGVSHDGTPRSHDGQRHPRVIRIRVPDKNPCGTSCSAAASVVAMKGGRKTSESV